MILNMVGGGGAGLNFKIIGNPQPSVASENTIWLNTDVPITGYDFNATEPANPVEGMAWITVGTSSAVAFSATKKNPVMVYPLSAKQYVSGAWVGLIAIVYQNGEWIRAGALYWRGSQCEKITGGWVKHGDTSVAGATIGNVTFGENEMELSAIAKNATNGQGFVYASTSNLIDLTNVKTVFFNVPSFTKRTTDGLLGIYKSTEQWKLDSSTRAAHTTFDRAGVYSIDVTSLTGSYYVGAMLYTTDKTNYATMRIGEVWTE